MANSSGGQARSTKRCFKGTPINNDKQIEDWLEQLEEDVEFSDVDDSVEDPDFEVENVQGPEESRIESESEPEECAEEEPCEREEEQSESDDNEPLNLLANRIRNQTNSHFTGKNGFMWSKSEVGRTSRTPAHNIIQVS